mmetsp:Transcript_88680/g.286487  ORF Transcript_88680/g.286487 Transcript_88680/m.286487 type:complete len:716 (-) Transcript_88680:73-2220(-)
MARSRSAALASVGAVLLAATHASALVEGPWSNLALPAEERARLLVGKMTQQEKLSLLHGNPNRECQCNHSQSCAYVGNVESVPRLGIPPITMNDGPQGFRDDQHPATTTAWPSGLTMAASWDEDAVLEWGKGMGKEFYAKGSNVQLGPGLCLARIPRNGRNFEYLSGEDPYLGYRLAQPAIRGIQSQKVVANAKHWVMNNQETARDSVSEEVDERTRYEMYYPPFEGAIEAGVGSFMCSYNKINGIWSCENPETLKHDLKEVLGFKGYVMSDWGATHSTSIMAGLDNEQASADWMDDELISAELAAGVTTQAAVDDSVTRILWSMFSVGVMDEPVSTWDFFNLTKNVTSDVASDSARHLSAISTVLLKNDGDILPLPQGKRLAVIGKADDKAIVHAGGSGSVVPSFVPWPLDGVRGAAGQGATVQFNDGSDTEAAAKLAQAADYTIVFIGCLSAEGSDRDDLSIGDEDLVVAIAKASSKVIVVASVPGAVLMPWSKDVAAILTNFMPGQQAGNAIADVLFGKVNPSAKLPLTFPNVENETKLTPEQWPGVPDVSQPFYAFYAEKLLVGYRYYDAHGLTFDTGFPFGHGLSYTTFAYSDLSVRKSIHGAGMLVQFKVSNTGKVAGSEVAQLYLAFPSIAGEPPLQLKGFKKTESLKPGETVQVELELRTRDLSIYDATAHRWTPVAGTFRANVGASSRDIRLRGDFLYEGATSVYV